MDAGRLAGYWFAVFHWEVGRRGTGLRLDCRQTRLDTAECILSRGLMEPSLVELSSGRVLVVWRGSNLEINAPGRKWFSFSSDGGLTLSKVQELKYGDGSQFYSPSSLHRFIRHSVSEKLYWVGKCSSNRRFSSVLFFSS